MKAGPRQSQFEPSEGKAVMFSDVHGVDEAKEVTLYIMSTEYVVKSCFCRNLKTSLLFSRIHPPFLR